MSEKLKDVEVVVITLPPDSLTISIEAVLHTPSDSTLGCVLNKIIQGNKLVHTILIQIISKGGASP